MKCESCRFWSELLAYAETPGPVMAMCLNPDSPDCGDYTANLHKCNFWLVCEMGEMAARGVGEDFPMIQYLQLSLFDVMPDAEVDSLIEQLPCRVAKSRIRSAKPKLPYFHWRITNIYDYAVHPIDCLKGPYEKTGFALRLYPKGWGVYTGAIQHVSKRNVFAMLEWLHEQQAKPRKELFNPKEVLYDQNRSHNAGL